MNLQQLNFLKPAVLDVQELDLSQYCENGDLCTLERRLETCDTILEWAIHKDEG